MNWIAISAIGDMLAAAGVIGSLIFVGMQIKRDREATAIDTVNKRQVGAREVLMSAATTPYLAPIMAKVGKGKLLGPAAALAREFDLEPEEAIRLSMFYTTMVRQASTLLRMPMPEAERAELEATFLAGLSGPMGIWWEEGKRPLSADFVAEIDRKLRAAAS